MDGRTHRQVTETDMYYLQDEDLARQLVELGYRGSGDTLQRWAVRGRYFEAYLLSVGWVAYAYLVNVPHK